MKKTNLRRICAGLLAVLLLVSALPLSASAAAIITVTEPEMKAAVLKRFNDAVNAVKTDRPGFTITASGDVTQEDEGDGAASEWIGMLVNNVFLSENSLTSDLFSNLTDENSDEGNTVTESFGKGEDNRAKTPVAGKDYVSALTTNAKFTMKTLHNETKKTTEILIQFPECTLDAALKSEMVNLFDLPTSTDIRVTDDVSGVVEGGVFSLRDVTCTEAYVDIILDENDKLISYTANIKYRIRVGMYGILNALPDFILKLFGLGKLNFGISIDTIMRLIGKFVDFDPDSALGGADKIANYAVQYKMKDFDWTPRYYGDIDYDNQVTAADARAVLRFAVALDKPANASDAAFADLDFDNKITAADARLTLRIAAGLEHKFTSYAMRRAQLNGTWEGPETPEQPVEPPEVPEIPIEF